ncbi:MAG: hypothetical protein COA52_09570 [Hyphomicrobiales bacterium]|nr:MAG: hypothetical protein COA52_09570 [Hyphomicrobiales bacterium]
MKLAACAAIALCQPAFAGEADVVAAKAVQSSGGSWRIDATIRHDDEGWDHFANQFDVVTPDGTVLGTRTLFHPHVNEQPFTRSLSSLQIPADVSVITVRAKDSVHGYGGAEIQIELPR